MRFVRILPSALQACSVNHPRGFFAARCCCADAMAHRRRCGGSGRCARRPMYCSRPRTHPRAHKLLTADCRAFRYAAYASASKLASDDTIMLSAQRSQAVNIVRFHTIILLKAQRPPTAMPRQHVCRRCSRHLTSSHRAHILVRLNHLLGRCAARPYICSLITAQVSTGSTSSVIAMYCKKSRPTHLAQDNYRLWPDKTVLQDLIARTASRTHTRSSKRH